MRLQSRPAGDVRYNGPEDNGMLMLFELKLHVDLIAWIANKSVPVPWPTIRPAESWERN